ncbi:TerC family protein [Geothrix sp.]|jgi:predicted tellurium resistance membrane protein TerC|uniref:TerC family protein n=1 Tax=Geothrix sp. TaxID=1962974 RepID=UPI0025BF69BF|nr:TerC family protein [Geothrix sp.]
MSWMTSPEAWIALLTLTVLEIVLGIDNIIFISILAGKLPAEKQAKARQTGLLLAMGMRIVLLMSIAWIVKLTNPLFQILGRGFSGRDLILLGGGLFLIAKATHEIHHKLEGIEGASVKKVAPSFSGVLIQIMLLDIVFSLDSVITAVGMAQDLAVMVTAVVISVGVMMLAAKPIGDFVETHPTLKILALSFLLLIGTTLVGEGTGMHIPKGYIYFAMAFSLLVEMLNLRLRVKAKPVHLHSEWTEEPGKAPDQRP